MLTNASALRAHLEGLRAHFLPDDKLTALIGEEDFEQDLDARGYLVLAHSGFEQFFEDTAVDFGTAVIDQWFTSSVLSRQAALSMACMASTLGSFGKVLLGGKDPFQAPDERKSDVSDEPMVADTSGDVLRADVHPKTVFSKLLRDFIKSYKAMVIEKNHGTDLHYLQGIFVPLGVYVDLTPDARSGLTHIANARGTFAHRRTAVHHGKFAYKPLDGTKAISSTEQLLNWCESFETDLFDSVRPDFARLHSSARAELLHRLANTLSSLAQNR